MPDLLPAMSSDPWDCVGPMPPSSETGSEAGLSLQGWAWGTKMEDALFAGQLALHKSEHRAAELAGALCSLEERQVCFESVEQTHHRKMMLHVDNLQLAIKECEHMVVAFRASAEREDSSTSRAVAHEIGRLRSEAAVANEIQSRAQERLKKLEDGVMDHARLLFAKLDACPWRGEVGSLALRIVPECRTSMFEACQTMD